MKPEENKKPLEDRDLETVVAGTDERERHIPSTDSWDSIIKPEDPDPRPLRPGNGVILVGTKEHDEQFITP